ncbi:MAG: EAL domain-containing protein [Methylococcales bacterium]|nr:EAL domain-containing protein [Methylococcales bacterium]
MTAKNYNNYLSESDTKRYFQHALTASGHCLWRLDKEGYLIEITSNIAQLSGHNLADVKSRHLIDFIIEREREAFGTLLQRQKSFLNYPVTFYHKENKKINFKVSADPIFNNEIFEGYQGIFINTTEYTKMEAKLRQSETNLANAQRISHLGSWDLDLISNELFWSDEIYRILGKEPGSIKANQDEFMKVIHPDDLEMVTDSMNNAMVTTRYDTQHRIIQADGKIGILHGRGEVLFDNGLAVRMVGTTQDITALKEAEQKIVELVNYDFLTNLPNRSLFNRQTNQLLSIAKKNNQSCALYCIGLDRFKLINESMGHEAGNELLCAVAKRLEHYPNSDEYIARLNGDEFALIKLNTSNESTAALLAQKIIDDFSAPFLIQDQKIVTSLSIGITLYSFESHDSNDLLKDAQTAMHRAKTAGGNSYQFYSLEMTDKIKHRLILENHLRQALESEEFILYYQPKVSAKTGKIAGAEALIRWQHPDGELIPPLEFISILEETGLIIPVGEWALKALCKQYTSWQKMGFDDLSLSLNLSLKQFTDKNLFSKIKAILEQFTKNNDFLELEITESLLMSDVEGATKTLQQLHTLGIKLSIDDFGTGYSSLSYLKHLPVDTLKIDRSFVMGLPDDKKDAAIVDVIITLARSLDLEIVAEGIETKGQLDFLAKKGCDYVQGYYYSKPVPNDEFIRLLQNENKK